MTFRHKIVSAGLVVALAGPAAFAVAPAGVALADPASDLASASTQLDSLGSELASYQSQLSDATETLESTDYDIAEKQAQIEQTQQELEDKQAELGGNMRSSYKSGSQTTLDFVLGSTSPEDLVSRIYYLDKVSEQQASNIADVRQIEDQLEQEMGELEDQQASQQAQVDAMQTQVSEYQSRVAEATSLYDSLDAEVQAQLAAEASSNVAAAVAAVDTNNAALTATGGAAGTGGSTTTQTATSTGTSSNSGTTNTNSNTNSNTSGGGSSSGSGSSGSTAPVGGGVSTALAQVGKPYVWGATGPSSFDCSGLVCYSYGYARGRDTYSMIASVKASGGWKSSQDQLSYGDLVFTNGGAHVGIYVGGGQMVHAPSPGTNVKVGNIYGFYGGGSYY
ncbi:C40 family peptidase [Thermophilibacter immobilis]|uniref:C40 family peptidase n=1 Tax=Thermophilibacter immobilis TaxID=2779519 RepID=A0A7S7MA10_9ACTN|nr:C40 family peptidase [Thermophilibacter immobilis]QOY61497.1 C40 family peptidase [Thermophilibacter immobilis]